MRTLPATWPTFGARAASSGCSSSPPKRHSGSPRALWPRPAATLFAAPDQRATGAPSDSSVASAALAAASVASGSSSGSDRAARAS